MTYGILINTTENTKTGHIYTPRIVHTVPRQFRILVKKDGSEVLQGGYFWHIGDTEHGIEWRDIPKVKEE